MHSLLRSRIHIQSSPSTVTPDIVTSLPISTFALAQVTNKLIKKNLSLVTLYSIFIITPFFLVLRSVTIEGSTVNTLNSREYTKGQSDRQIAQKIQNNTGLT